MHHNGDRTDRQLTAGLSQTVSPPVGPDDRLRDGTSRRLKLKWNAVRVAQHLHRLVFAQVNISHCGEKRSEEHTSELQSHSDLVCRLLLEKKKKKYHNT